MSVPSTNKTSLPAWVPAEARLYLTHTDDGRSLRAIAREQGVHASTVMRQVRRFEHRREDPLVDCALGRLREATGSTHDTEHMEGRDMTLHIRTSTRAPAALLDEESLDAEAVRILRRMSEPGVIMAVAEDMDRAVVLRDGAEGAIRLGVLDRRVAEAFALREWISCSKPGRVARYIITSQGRAALRRLIDGAEADEERGEDEPARGRYCQTESPVVVLARRRDKDGKPFLGPELVVAAERLREDFEVAQTGPRQGQDWDRFLTAGVSGGATGGGAGHGPMAARDRLIAALNELGPGLGDVALRCCCHLEGVEAAEQAMGWSARSGKIVLRIALMRLKRHYDSLGDSAKMIG
jgi:hypothetical protein